MTHLKVFESRPQPTLEDIEIQSPCEVPWDSLRGNDRVRACGKCRENVYNISAMTRVEALHLIRATEGRVCVRIHRRPDGTVVTGDCWSRLRAARKRGILVFVGVLLVVGCVQLVAMLVGLRGLRNLVSRHQMGEMPASLERPIAIALPAPPPRIEPDEQWMQGRMLPDAPETKRPGHAPKKRQKVISRQADDIFAVGRLGRRLPQ